MIRCLLVLFFIGSWPAFADDSVAEIKTGGLVLARTDAIVMDREQLYISLDEIQVAYRFRNRTDKDVETVVAFPMPDIRFNPYGDTALPDFKSDNFLDFSATLEGMPVTVNLEQKAFAEELDVTQELKAAGIPLFPFGKAAERALGTLPAATIKDWTNRGIIFMSRYDAGDGMRYHPTPFWVLKSTYWWRMTFPAGRSIMVEHRYKPSVGGYTGVNFFQDGRFGGKAHRDYVQRYCIDPAFEQSVRKVMKERNVLYPPFTESRISFVLRTANNWAGPINSFSVTINTGSTKTLASFCGDDIRRLDPTTVEMTKTNFYPDRDLDVLFLKPAGW